jgi:hypothetical protein
VEITGRVYRPRRPREWLGEELLAPVPHRHVVLTVPRLLRPLFRRRRDLLVELVELLRRATGEDLRSGLVVSLATACDLLKKLVYLDLHKAVLYRSPA